MRLTRVLLKESHRFRLRQLWQNKGHIKTPASSIPVYLRQTGIEPIDANEVAKEPRKFPTDFEFPDRGDPRFNAAPTDPDYHDDPVYEFTYRTRLLHGLDQACVLTKTQPLEGLPPSVTDLVGALAIPDQDELVQRVIMQANVWDPTKDKLPRRFNPALPGWKFKAEYGIPNSRITSLTIRGLANLCQMITASNPDLLTSRKVVHDHLLHVFYYFQGDKHVIIKNLHDTIVSSSRPLPPLASEEQVDQSATYTLPDLYPVLPTIGLEQQHVWRLENITGWLEGATHIHPHLIFCSFDNYWTTSQRNAMALLNCFGHTMGLAKKLYGDNVTDLPQPISTQCVLTNGSTFNFACFQLNTLKTESEHGIKNLAWFDSENMLFNKILPKRAMLRNTKYEDYDSEVFQKLLALYVNGGQLEAAQRKSATN